MNQAELDKIRGTLKSQYSAKLNKIKEQLKSLESKAANLPKPQGAPGFVSSYTPGSPEFIAQLSAKAVPPQLSWIKSQEYTRVYNIVMRPSDPIEMLLNTSAVLRGVGTWSKGLAFDGMQRFFGLVGSVFAVGSSLSSLDLSSKAFEYSISKAKETISLIDQYLSKINSISAKEEEELSRKINIAEGSILATPPDFKGALGGIRATVDTATTYSNDYANKAAAELPFAKGVAAKLLSGSANLSGEPFNSQPASVNTAGGNPTQVVSRQAVNTPPKPSQAVVNRTNPPRPAPPARPIRRR